MLRNMAHRKPGTPCVKKKRYPNEEAARKALLDTMIVRAFRKKGWMRRHERRYYFCNICKGWHLTAQVKDPRRSRRRAA